MTVYLSVLFLNIFLAHVIFAMNLGSQTEQKWCCNVSADNILCVNCLHLYLLLGSDYLYGEKETTV